MEFPEHDSPPDNTDERASMDIIEAYVDVVRRAKGKLTLSEIDIDLPDFEDHLEDFVRDVFRTMTIDDHK
ncbi:protein of unknown function [Pararobbsia alpina]|uniref:hypothetical protein n=1 Tax=Pararobbsia alpina TaxID=621374 RepID=UPI0039A55F21